MAIRTDFTPGEVLAAADLNDTFASKVDYATPTNAQTGTAYTFVADDADRLTTASNGSAVTFTIPPQSSVTWGDDTILRVVNYGAGAVTVDGGSGVTVTNTATTVAQYQAAAAIRTGSDAWTLVPFAGGGEIPAAEISSPSATGQYTDTGITYDYYTFTASGSLTVDTAGFADVLVIGGGGAGGESGASISAGGGGAGGHYEYADLYMPAGSYTVTVGAGGARNTRWAGRGGVASQIDTLIVSAGGGGGGSYDAISPGASRGLMGASSGGSFAVDSAIPGLGNIGHAAVSTYDGGGGGAGGAATSINGGAGKANSYTGSSVTRAGGGSGITAAGGSGTTTGGGGTAGNSGTANTGGGGGGGRYSQNNSGNGGSGIVIVRVKV